MAGESTLNNLCSIQHRPAGIGSIAVTQWQWFAPKKVLLPGGTEQRMEYDGYQSLTSLKVINPAQAVLFELQNQYGKLAEITQTTLDGNTQSYNHDDAGRLSAVSASMLSARSETFTQDAASNRLTHSKTGTNTWQYDSANQLTQRPSANAGTVSYQYDASGNLSSKTDTALNEPARTTTYRYDALNRLSEIIDGAGDLIARYRYDPFDRRLSKELGTSATLAANNLAGATTTHYLQTEWGLLAEANASGQVQVSYGWSPQRQDATFPLYARVPDPAAPGSYRYVYYHNDALGTPQRITDKAANLIWAADYDAFGSAHVKTSANPALALTNNLRYPGQYFDSESGLHYNDRRCYDPSSGRYTSRDPIGFEGGINLYTYAAAAPNRFTDPTGEFIHCLVYNYLRCMAACVGEEAVMHYVMGCGDFDLKGEAIECAKNCVWAMLPIPDPCGKFGQLFSTAVGMFAGLMNSFPADTLVHTRIQTDSGYQAVLKPIDQIRVGDEVLAWDEVKAHDLAQTQVTQTQTKTQAKEAPSPRNVSTGSSRIDSIDVAIPATALAADSAATSLGSAQSYQKVTQVYHTPEQVRTLVHLRLVLPDGSTQSLPATDGHPLKTQEGWRDAVLLKKGGQLLLGGGEVDSEPPRYASIADVRIEHARIATFNLEVANLHTFYVGADGVVVHNYSFGDLRGAVQRAYDILGVSRLPKCGPGKWGSPQRGNAKKGIRFDKQGHPNHPNPDEHGPHINWWDYTDGKRGKGGGSGALPL